jgi:hypothetical protein
VSGSVIVVFVTTFDTDSTPASANALIHTKYYGADILRQMVAFPYSEKSYLTIAWFSAALFRKRQNLKQSVKQESYEIFFPSPC